MWSEPRPWVISNPGRGAPRRAGRRTGPALRGKGLNAEVKLLLLGHAFEDCGFERVKLQTDSINQHSRDAIVRLGAVQEGVLRHHQPRADGSWRDTVVFSILSAEWPTVQAGLESRVRATLASLTTQGS